MPVETDAFRWTQAYSVNIAHLDKQHEQLFDTINELNDALSAGESKAVLDRVLQKLVNYALVHFASEETLMERYSFPGLLTHRAQHDMFREKIAVFLQEHEAGRAGVAVSLMLFMQSWLKTHVIRADKQYSAFLNAHGVR